MVFLNREYRATIGGLCALQTKMACCKPTGCSGARALNTIACRAASGEQPAFGMVKTYAIWCALHNEQRRNLQDWLHGGASVDARRGRDYLVCGGNLERTVKVLRIQRCANCRARIFLPIGTSAWVHVSPRLWRCQVQQAIGYHPIAVPQGSEFLSEANAGWNEMRYGMPEADQIGLGLGLGV